MNNIIRPQNRDQETIGIIEARLGGTLNRAQREIMERLMDSERDGTLVAVPCARRAGKTTLAKILMLCISDAVCIVPEARMADLYDASLHDRMYTGNPEMNGISPSLIIFDEVTDMNIVEHIRRRMYSSRLLQLYTPRMWEMAEAPADWHHVRMHRAEWPVENPYEGMTFREDGDYETMTRARVEAQHAEMQQRERDLQRQMEQLTARNAERGPQVDDVRRLLDDMLLNPILSLFDEAAKSTGKEWDEDENVD